MIDLSIQELLVKIPTSVILNASPMRWRYTQPHRDNKQCTLSFYVNWGIFLAHIPRKWKFWLSEAIFFVNYKYQDTQLKVAQIFSPQLTRSVLAGHLQSKSVNQKYDQGFRSLRHNWSITLILIYPLWSQISQFQAKFSEKNQKELFLSVSHIIEENIVQSYPSKLS